MHESDRVFVGIVGLGLSACLWILSSWRLVYHTLVCRRRNDDSDSEGGPPTSERPRPPLAKWFTRRRSFHLLLWAATSCEALAYADMAGFLPCTLKRSFGDKLGYILLDVAGRSILELVAFSTVTAMWLHIAIESGPSVFWGSHWGSHHLRFGLLPPIFVMVMILLVLASATLSVAALLLFQRDDLATIQSLTLTRAQVLLEAIAWGVHSLVVLECLILTSRRILTLVPAQEWRTRVSLWMKAVLPMLVSSAVYALRCGLLAAVFCHAVKVERGTWDWWIGFMWCPTWLAVGCLLYSARKRDQLPPAEELQQPLLPARPPAEAFIAFSQHRQGLDMDDSFCLSPQPRAFAPRDEPGVCDDEPASPTDSPEETPHAHRV